MYSMLVFHKITWRSGRIAVDTGCGIYFPTIFQVQTSPIALFLTIIHFHIFSFLFYDDHSGCTTYTLYQSQGSNGKSASPRVSTSGFVPSTVGQSLISTPNLGVWGLCTTKAKPILSSCFVLDRDPPASRPNIGSTLKPECDASVPAWKRRSRLTWATRPCLRRRAQLSPRSTRTVLYAIHM